MKKSNDSKLNLSIEQWDSVASAWLNRYLETKIKLDELEAELEKKEAEIIMKDGEIERWKSVWRSNKKDIEMLSEEVIRNLK